MSLNGGYNKTTIGSIRRVIMPFAIIHYTNVGVMSQWLMILSCQYFLFLFLLLFYCIPYLMIYFFSFFLSFYCFCVFYDVDYCHNPEKNPFFFCFFFFFSLCFTLCSAVCFSFSLFSFIISSRFIPLITPKSVRYPV